MPARASCSAERIHKATARTLTGHFLFVCFVFFFFLRADFCPSWLIVAKVLVYGGMKERSIRFRHYITGSGGGGGVGY